MKTLQELCLEKIVQDFDRHILAYSTSTKLKSSYEVLRRIYSFKIIQKLQENYEVRAEYIDFLINKYLKTLDTDWFDNCPWDAIEKKFAEIGPGLEKLYVNDGDDRDSSVHWEDLLCQSPNLKVVSFESCTDDYLACISKFCPKVESITFGTYHAISHRGFQYLCRDEIGVNPCPRLKEIVCSNVSGYSPGVEDVTYLIKNLPSLEKLTNFDGLAEILYSIHKDDIHNLRKIKPYNLTDLDMRNLWHCESFEDVSKVCLLLCPQLKNLLALVLKQEHLNLYSELTELQHLSLYNLNYQLFQLDDFLKAKKSNLITLNFDRFTFSLANLALTCPHLSTLLLRDVKFLKNDHDTVPIFSNLKSLTLEYMFNETDSLTSRAVTSLLTSSPNLEWLVIQYCEFFDSDVKAGILKRCENGKIGHISFHYSKVHYKFVHDILLSCSSLKSLNLGNSVVKMDNDVEITEFEKIELKAVASNVPNKPNVIFHSTVRSDYSFDHEDSLDLY